MRTKLIVTSICLFALTGCMSPSFITRSTQIDAGATKTDVTSKLGPPRNRQFQAKDEAWQYCDYGYGTTDAYVIVWFYDSRVTGIQTYNENKKHDKHGYGDSCTSYRTVNWEDAPDKSYEFRTR